MDELVHNVADNVTQTKLELVGKIRPLSWIIVVQPATGSQARGGERGKPFMEQGGTDEVFSPPYHPYTEALLSAVPIADTSVKKKRIILEGALPSVLDPPSGCPFHTRCPRKIGAVCEEQTPPVLRTESGHSISCHIPLDELRKVDPVITTAA